MTTRVSRWHLVLVAIAIAMAVVLAFRVAGAMLYSSPLNLGDEAIVAVALAAFPFLTLALVGATSRLPWVIGVASTSILWTWLLVGSASEQTFLLVFLGAPLPIAAMCLAAHWLTSTRA